MPTDATLAPPDRSTRQRMEALAQANAVRSRRAQLKRELRAGGTYRSLGEVVALLADPPEWVATMRLFDLLLATPKYGRVKVNRILARARVSPSKTVGGLSDRQRGELVRMLRTGGWR